MAQFHQSEFPFQLYVFFGSDKWSVGKSKKQIPSFSKKISVPEEGSNKCTNFCISASRERERAYILDADASGVRLGRPFVATARAGESYQLPQQNIRT